MRGGGVVAMADLLGDFGARDPFPEEVESNFAEKVLGDVDTLHRILIPTLSALSLARLPLDPNPTPLAIDDARKLLLKVVGWRLLAGDDHEEGMRLQCLWKVRDEACGQELIARITTALDGAGHAPTTLLLEPPNQVKAELYSRSIGSRLNSNIMMHMIHIILVVVCICSNRQANRVPNSSAGGLSMNDFIVAARIDKVKTLDLIPKKRVWA